MERRDLLKRATALTALTFSVAGCSGGGGSGGDGSGGGGSGNDSGGAGSDGGGGSDGGDGGDGGGGSDGGDGGDGGGGTTTGGDGGNTTTDDGATTTSGGTTGGDGSSGSASIGSIKPNTNGNGLEVEFEADAPRPKIVVKHDGKTLGSAEPFGTTADVDVAPKTLADGGEFTVEILDGQSVVASKTATIEGVNITISEFEKQVNEDGSKYDVSVKLSIKNTGDVPALATKIVAEYGGKQYESTFSGGGKYVHDPGVDYQYAFGNLEDSFSAGDYTVKVAVEYQGATIGTATRSMTVP